MKVSELKAYEVFKNRSDEKDTEIVFDFFEANKTDLVSSRQVDDRLKDFKEIFATKEDIAKLETKLAENKSEMIKWMYIFWGSQLVAMFAFLKYFK